MDCATTEARACIKQLAHLLDCSSNSGKLSLPNFGSALSSMLTPAISAAALTARGGSRSQCNSTFD